MSLRIVLITFILCLASSTLLAQKMERKNLEKVNSFLIDSLLQRQKPRNPKKALLLSAILPGAGQVYNKQYYKLHFVYGGLGGMMYAIDYNRRRYHLYRDAYAARVRGEEPLGFEGIPDLALKNVRDQARKNSELSYMGLGLVYLLNVADAFISAHLSDFDINEDLSVKVKPFDTHLVTSTPYPAVGFSVKIK